MLKRWHVLNRLYAAISALNDYFFDVDPNEPPDYVSAAIFYGSILAILAVGIMVAILAIISV